MVDWLTAPPIRNVTPVKRSYGSFNYGIHGKTGYSPGQYTETTGYGISLLAYLFHCYQDETYLQYAREAADFLLSIQLEEGAFPHCPEPDSACMQKERHTLDTAVCVTGLLDLYDFQPDRRYLESAIRAGHWLISMQTSEGSFMARQSDRSFVHQNRRFFSGEGSCVLTKIAIALSKLAEHNPTAEYEEALRALCGYTLGLQAPQGFFWSTSRRNFVFTQAHCHACDGLLAAGVHLDDDVYLEAAMRGIHWLGRSQNKDGSMLQVYVDRRGGREHLRRSIETLKAADATAQAARLFVLAGQAFELHYRKALDFLNDKMLSADGGHYYTRGRFNTNYMMYTWTTMLAVQAMEFARQKKSTRFLF